MTTNPRQYQIRVAGRAKALAAEFELVGYAADLTEANRKAQGLTYAADIKRARVTTPTGQIATEYGPNGVLLRYRNDV